jgi:predicted N-acyltransferase
MDDRSDDESGAGSASGTDDRKTALGSGGPAIATESVTARSRHVNRAGTTLELLGKSWSLELNDSLDALQAFEWDALLQASSEPTPFLRHAFLAALHTSGSACADTGWQPLLLTARRGGQLEAAVALHLKDHSYGEYVFDWAWADAYQRAGQRYYPKLLGAVPFTPVPGSRLLARSDEAREVLLQGIEQVMRQHRLSSAHLLFMSEADRASAQAAGWLLRSTVQFHWQNRSPLPYADFDDFLATLQRDKRKKIAQERRYVREAGVSFRALRGTEISSADWDFFYRCYTLTYQAHRSEPYLTRDFFARMAAEMAEHWLLFIAERGGEPVAASLIALDPARQVAYGRYWGATEAVSCLHFEACYYQPLAWCIAQGWQRFEGGAQGEHKMARGLLPVTTWSAHKLSHPAFEQAVAQYLEREGHGVAAYVDELREHSPFKRSAANTPATPASSAEPSG